MFPKSRPSDLLHFAEKCEMLHGFDEELFEKHVRQITVKTAPSSVLNSNADFA